MKRQRPVMKLDEAADRSTGRRRVVFTEMVLAKIPLWIIDGWTLDAIAIHIGTNTSSLLATCSRLGISLKGAKQPKSKRVMDELVLRLPKHLAEKLERRAFDLSMSTEHLAIVLLNQIVIDDLFEAVLDFDDLGRRKT